MVEAVRQSAISRECEYLAGDISTLSSTASEFVERLSQVLAPSVPRDTVNAGVTKGEAQCQLSANIASQRDRVQDVTAKLQDLLNRLEV